MSPEAGSPAPVDLGKERLLNAVETALLLGVSIRRLREWRRSRNPGGPPFVRLSGVEVRYPLAGLRQFIVERTVARGNARRPIENYRLLKIEKLGRQHPGLVDFIVGEQRRRVANRLIAVAVLEKWGEVLSEQVLSSFYQLRTWPRECDERREAERAAKR